jgi:Nucleotide-diphospho-sugar transferase
MILNTEEVEDFFRKIAIKNSVTQGTLVFTNGNKTYIETLILNLLESYKNVGSTACPIGVFCSDAMAYSRSVELGMNSCYVKIPSLGVDDAYSSACAGSELYLRLCFVKILLIKYALQLGYDVLYIDPDMAFNKNCLPELVGINSALTFAKLIRGVGYVFVNSNIMRVYPTAETFRIFDFVVTRDLSRYLEMLPDVGDETFIRERLLLNPCIGNSLDSSEYPSGADSKYSAPGRIKMYHANCIVGLDNKISYLRENKVWFL